MAVKELKEKLEQFDDNLIVMIPNIDWNPYNNSHHDVLATHVSRGVNEFDGCVFIDDYIEEDEDNTPELNICSGCIYENIDDTTDAIGMCVCCKRKVDFAKHDCYTTR